MGANLLRGAGVIIAAAGSLAGVAARADTGGVSNTSDAGPTTVLYRGPRIQAAVSCRYARYHPAGTWLLLDAEMGAAGAPIMIPRSDIAVRTPGGEVVLLATQEEFEKGYAELASPIKLADFHREGLAYLLPERPRPLDLFRLHGVGWVWPWVVLDPFHNCYGRLYFHLPNGVHRGRYELLIRLPKDQIVIPFTL